MAGDRGGRPPPTQQSPWQFTVGGRVGLVVVRRGKSDENNVNRLQKRLSPLPRTRPGHRLGLYVRVSSAQVGEGRAGIDESSTSSTIRSAERHLKRGRA